MDPGHAYDECLGPFIPLFSHSFFYRDSYHVGYTFDDLGPTVLDEASTAITAVSTSDFSSQSGQFVVGGVAVTIALLVASILLQLVMGCSARKVVVTSSVNHASSPTNTV